MYTSKFTLYVAGDLRLISYGRGAAYELRNGKASVFFQGDDADMINGELELIERMNPDATAVNILSTLWADYEGVATNSD